MTRLTFDASAGNAMTRRALTLAVVGSIITGCGEYRDPFGFPAENEADIHIAGPWMGAFKDVNGKHDSPYPAESTITVDVAHDSVTVNGFCPDGSGSISAAYFARGWILVGDITADIAYRCPSIPSPCGETAILVTNASAGTFTGDTLTFVLNTKISECGEEQYIANFSALMRRPTGGP